MAELTRCRHNETGAEAELPTEALGAWHAHGWDPISDSRSFEAADVERVQAEEAAAAHIQGVIETLSSTKRPNIDAVLEEVAEDPAAAAAAMQIEQARENPRTTLVDRLNQIINPAGDAGTQKEN
jgi:hypothetical protein